MRARALQSSPSFEFCRIKAYSVNPHGGSNRCCDDLNAAPVCRSPARANEAVEGWNVQNWAVRAMPGWTK